MKKKEGKKASPNRVFVVTLVLSLVFTLCMGFILYRQVQEYEEGILEVSAYQQDEYVRLVIEQIYLKENRTDEEMIREILGTLDTSGSKYWTLSSDQTMLYLKDITETNRYRNLSAASYYDSSSAAAFFRSLKAKKVVHREIVVDGETYMASGAAFEYGDKVYKICLLSNREALLDNNRYLSAKVNLMVGYVTLAVVLILASAFLSHRLASERRKNAKLQAEGKELAVRLEKAGIRERRNEMYDMNRDYWERDALPSFLRAIREQDRFPLCAGVYRFAGPEEAASFAKKATQLLGAKVLKFRLSETKMLVLMPGATEEGAERAKVVLESNDATAQIVWYRDAEEMDQALQAFLK